MLKLSRRYFRRVYCGWSGDSGLRILFQGCPRHCEGCHNPDLLQPFEGGTEYSPQQLADEVFPKLTPLHRGITLSGGESVGAGGRHFRVSEAGA